MDEYVGWSDHTASSRRRMIEEDGDREQDRLPDLIDQNRFDNPNIQRMYEQHLARREAEQQALLAQPQQPQQPVNLPEVAAAAAAIAAAEEEEPFDVGDDINGVLEAIGMRGNPWMLVQNSVLMSLMISLCLGIAVWVPYVIGRLVILVK